MPRPALQTASASLGSGSTLFLLAPFWGELVQSRVIVGTMACVKVPRRALNGSHALLWDFWSLRLLSLIFSLLF